MIDALSGTLRKAARRVALGVCAGLMACGGGGSSGPPPTPDVSAVTQAARPSTLPADWQRGVFMEIFVRAYQDSDGDGIGDLRGLTRRLDHLQQLGVTGLWLMPIHPSQDGDHGYAVTDYRAVAPEYGTLADLDELLAQAHARGIGVIIDYVMNHSAAQHPLFRNSRDSAGNPWHDWYVWQNPPPSGWSIFGGNPWRGSSTGAYFAPFWDQMPDFNLKNAAVAEWHRDNLRFWLNRGVDGFRFDAVGNLVEHGPSAWEHQPENHPLMAGVRGLLDGYGGRYLVCEAPSLPQRYAAADSCGSAFAFGYQYDVVSAARGDSAAIARVADYWRSAPEGMAGFASNHDGFAGERLWDQLGGNTAQLKLAAATYLLQSRRPFIYYGEEIGMAGAATLSGDPRLRTPMSWRADTGNAGFSTVRPFRALSANVSSQNVAAQQADAGSLLHHYRQLIALRKTLPVLATGRYAHAEALGRTLQFQRLGADPASAPGAWVGINYGDTPVALNVTGLPINTRLQRHWPAGAADVIADGAGLAVVTLPARSFAVFESVH